MAVVINEFEVIPAAQSKPPAANQQNAGDAAAPSSPLTPQEIADLVRRQMGRMARISAH